MDDKRIQKHLEQQRRQKERTRQRQLEKQASPEYRAKQLDKQRQAQERRQTNWIANKPKLVEKAQAQAKAQREKAIAKAKSTISAYPSYRAIKSKGMVGKTRTKSDINLHDKLGQLGCICCINLGLIQPYSGSLVSIHHIRGRTAPEAHKYVLPLCAWHHDTPLCAREGQNHPGVFPLHAKGSEGGKVKWERFHGTQMDLLCQVLSLVGEEALMNQLFPLNE